MHDYLINIYLIKVWGYMIYETAPFRFIDLCFVVLLISGLALNLSSDATR